MDQATTPSKNRGQEIAPGSDQAIASSPGKEIASGRGQAANRGRRQAIAVRLAACFFLSGAASLLFETVWARAFGLILGNSLQGISLVGATFLGGLGLGAALASRFADRVRRPIALYAALEGAIGLWGLLGMVVLPAMPGLLASVFASAEPGAGTAAARLAAAVLFLVPPTMLMGMSLPLLSAGLGRRSPFLSGFGWLYGLNTLGAFTGTVIGGFLLLPAWGGARTTLVACALDLAVFLAARGLSQVPQEEEDATAARSDAPAASAEAAAARRSRVDAAAEHAADASARGSSAQPAPVPAVLLGPICLLAGLVALVCEIAWTRGLSLILGGSSYTFSLLLAVFLLGGAGGSLLWRARRRAPRDPARTYALLLVALAVAIAGSLLVLDRSGEIFLRLYRLTAGHRALIVGGIFLQSAAAILVPAVILGLHFPLTAEMFRVSAAGMPPGAAAGRAYLWNSLGALAGSLLAGFVLLPALGTAATLRVAASLALILAALLLALRLRGPRELRLGSAAVLAALALAFALAGPGLDRLLWEQGVYRMVNHALVRQWGPKFVPEIQGEFQTRRRLFAREGRLSTVAVWYEDGNLSLAVGGKVDASYVDMPTQVLLGQLPMLAHPRPRDVFVLGYGSGVTCNSILTHDPVRMDIAEIEPAVVAGAGYFEHLTPRLREAPPSVHLLLEDGRTLLTYGRRSYDVIVSEPSNPWIAGVNTLFTREFYRIVRSRLNLGGVFCQWYPLYELSPATLGAMLRALSTVFPHYVLLEVKDDLICLASPDGLPAAGPGMWARALARPEVRAELAGVGILRPEDLEVRLVGDESWAASRPGPLNTDDNGYVAYRAPWELPAFQERQLVFEAQDLAAREPLRLWGRLGWTTGTGAEAAQLVDAALWRGRAGLARDLLAEWRARSGLGAPDPALVARAQEAARTGESRRDAALRLMTQSFPLRGRDPRAALQLMWQAHALDPLNTEISNWLSRQLLEAGQWDELERVIEPELRRGVWFRRYDLLLRQAIAAMRHEPAEAALRDFEAMTALDPYREEAYTCAAKLLLQQGRVETADSVNQAGLRHVPESRYLAAVQAEIQRQRGAPDPSAAPSRSTGIPSP